MDLVTFSFYAGSETNEAFVLIFSVIGERNELKTNTKTVFKVKLKSIYWYTKITGLRYLYSKKRFATTAHWIYHNFSHLIFFIAYYDSLRWLIDSFVYVLAYSIVPMPSRRDLVTCNVDHDASTATSGDDIDWLSFTI